MSSRSQAAVHRGRVRAGVDDHGRARRRRSARARRPGRRRRPRAPSPSAASPGSAAGPGRRPPAAPQQASAADRRRSRHGAASATSTVRSGEHRQRPGRRCPSRPRPRAARRRAGDRRRSRPRSSREVPSSRPRGGQTSPTSPPARPSTVAGPTAGADREVGGDRDEADLARDRGDHRRAGQLGGGRDRDRLRQPPGQPPRQRVAPARARAAGCRRWRAPTARSRRDTASHGSTSSSTTTATPSARGAAVPPVGAHRRAGRRSPSRPRARTLGSVRASSTNPTMPSAPTTYSQRPRTPHQRASTSRNPTTRVRLVPDTAIRWVSPVVAEVVGEVRVEPGVVAVDQRRAPAPAGWGAGARPSRGSSSRTASAPRHHTAGPADQLGSPVDGHDGGDSVTVRRRQPPDGAQPAPQPHPGPGVVGEDQHGGAEGVHPPAPGDLGDPGAEQHLLGVPPVHDPRVGGHGQLEGRDRVLVGQGGDRVVLDLLPGGARRSRPPPRRPAAHRRA